MCPWLWPLVFRNRDDMAHQQRQHRQNNNTPTAQQHTDRTTTHRQNESTSVDSSLRSSSSTRFETRLLIDAERRPAMPPEQARSNRRPSAIFGRAIYPSASAHQPLQLLTKSTGASTRRRRPVAWQCCSRERPKSCGASTVSHAESSNSRCND